MMSNITDIVKKIEQAFDCSEENRQQLIDSGDMAKDKSVTEYMMPWHNETYFDIIHPVLPRLLIEWLTEPLDTQIDKNLDFVDSVLSYFVPPSLHYTKDRHDYKRKDKEALVQWKNKMSVFSIKQRQAIGMTLRQMLEIPHYYFVWDLIENALKSNYWNSDDAIRNEQKKANDIHGLADIKTEQLAFSTSTETDLRMASEIDELVKEIKQEFDCSDKTKSQLIDSKNLAKYKSVTEYIFPWYKQTSPDEICLILPWLLIEWLTSPLDITQKQTYLFASHVLCCLQPSYLFLSNIEDIFERKEKGEIYLPVWEDAIAVFSDRQREVVGEVLRHLSKMPQYQLVELDIKFTLKCKHWDSDK